MKDHMKDVYLPRCLLSCLAMMVWVALPKNPFTSPSPASAAPQRPVAAYISHSRLLSTPVNYGETGFNEMVVLLPSNGRFLYDTTTTDAEIRTAVRSILAKTDTFTPRPRRVWLTFWCWSEVAEWSKPFSGGIWALPPDRHAAFKRNFTVLCDEARKRTDTGILMDAEYYPGTPGGNGGPMQPSRSWVSSPHLSKFSQEYAAILGNLPAGLYVYFDQAQSDLKGFRQFWKTVFTRNGGRGSVFFEDSFYGAKYGPVNTIKKIYFARPVAGRWYNVETESVERQRSWWNEALSRSGSAWLYDPSLSDSGTGYADAPKTSSKLKTVLSTIK
jgi:hypothetical protein